MLFDESQLNCCLLNIILLKGGIDDQERADCDIVVVASNQPYHWWEIAESASVYSSTSIILCIQLHDKE